MVAEFTAVSDDTSAAPGAGYAPANEAVHLRCATLMNLDVVPSGSVHRFAEAGEADAT